MLSPVTVGANPPQEDPHSASWAVRALQKARDTLVKEWADAWALRAVAYNQALGAIRSRDKDFYAHAQQTWIDAGKAQKQTADSFNTNDRLRAQLLGAIEDRVNLTSDQLAWFHQPFGLEPPAAYDSRKGGTAIPKFPEYA